MNYLPFLNREPTPARVCSVIVPVVWDRGHQSPTLNAIAHFLSMLMVCLFF